MTREKFIELVKNKTNDTVDVSEFNFINELSYGKCICKICGNVFEERADSLTRIGRKCNKCFKRKNLNKKVSTLEDVLNKINKFNNISITNYIDTKHYCLAKCNNCGHEWIPCVNDLINGHGCPKCAIRKLKEQWCDKHPNQIKTNVKLKKTDEEKRNGYKNIFIEKSIKKYKDRFSYENIEYVNKNTEIKLFCNKHKHYFNVKPKNHLMQYSGGCKFCIKEHENEISYSKKMTLELWKERCAKKWNNKYDYSLVTELNDFNNDIVKVICPIHGVFEIKAKTHIHDTGCKECTNRLPITYDNFFKKAHNVHGDKYDYSLVDRNITENTEIIEIICPIHGKFKQTINVHLSSCGCPTCNESHLEREVRLFLINNNIEYEPQKRFDWLGRQSLDFYLPKYNIGIECQGSQHFIADNYYSELGKVQEYDKKKRLLCKENGIELIYYQNKKYNKYSFDITNKIFNNIDELYSFLKILMA